MTKYAQTISEYSDRKNKRQVRDFLFSFFVDLQLRKIVGLAGPDIQQYMQYCKSKGFEEFEIYEKDAATVLHQLVNLDDKAVIKFKNILEANPDEEETLYDCDFCGTIKTHKEHVSKFTDRFIMTFSGRSSKKDTIKTFFAVRKERIIKERCYESPIPHTIYRTDNGGRYIFTSYYDTSTMYCIAKVA